jgi:hypothetical protein
MSDHIGYDAEMVAAFLEPRASENVPAQYAHALAHMAFYANAECEEWKAVAEGKLLGVLAERDALKAENEKLHTAILRSPGEIWWLNVADEERKRADALLRMNENLTEECERKHRLIEELKADRDSRDDKIDALKAQLADAAKVSDGVWEWVPKPKYDTLKAENVMLKEQIQKALKRLDEASEEGCLHTSIIATFMRRPDLDYEPLGEILDATKEGK